VEKGALFAVRITLVLYIVFKLLGDDLLSRGVDNTYDNIVKCHVFAFFFDIKI
jgi:hypothetical protein